MWLLSCLHCCTKGLPLPSRAMGERSGRLCFQFPMVLTAPYVFSLQPWPQSRQVKNVMGTGAGTLLCMARQYGLWFCVCRDDSSLIVGLNTGPCLFSRLLWGPLLCWNQGSEFIYLEAGVAYPHFDNFPWSHREVVRQVEQMETACHISSWFCPLLFIEK